MQELMQAAVAPMIRHLWMKSLNIVKSMLR